MSVNLLHFYFIFSFLNFQTIIRTQMIQRQQHPQPGQAAQQPDYSTQIMATGVGTVSTGGGSQVQGIVNQPMGAMSTNQQQQQQVYNANIRPNIRPPIPVQAAVANNAGRPSPNGTASSMVQQQQPQPQTPVQQVRPITVYQQQMLHMHIQSNKSLLMFINKIKHFKF